MFSFIRVAAILAALALSACGAGEAHDDITVDGGVGAVPILLYDAPLASTDTSVQVVWPGDGPTLGPGDPVLVHMYGEDGRDHTELTNTYASAPQQYVLDASSVGAGIAEALQGHQVGTRLLYREQDGDVPVVLVLDILPTVAYGAVVDAEEGVPTVAASRDGGPTITIPDGEPPSELIVAPLIRGSGPQIEAGATVSVRFVCAAWSSGEVVESNWEPTGGPLQTFTAGVGSANEGWDQGLLEQTVGSRVLLVVPPELALGGTDSPWAEETLVYAVDILDAFLPVAERALDAPDPSPSTEGIP